MINGQHEIVFSYSFLLSQIDIGFVESLKKENKSIICISEHLQKNYPNLDKESTFWTDELNIHLSEEHVPMPARLPIYFRFPHISISYFFKQVYLCDNNSKLDFKEPLNLKINIFVFESGAGIINFKFTSNRLNKIEDLTELKHFLNVSEPHYKSNFIYCDQIRQYFLTDSSLEKGKYFALHELFVSQLDYFVNTINTYNVDISKIQHDYNLIQRIQIANIKFRTLRKVDDSDVVYKLDNYYQRPIIFVFFTTNDSINSTGFPYSYDKVYKNIGCELGMESLEISNLELPARMENSRLIIGNNGIVLCTQDNDIPQTKILNYEIYEMIFRVFASIRMTWHSTAILKHFIGQELKLLSERSSFLEREKNFLKNIYSTNDDLDEIENLINSYYSFLTLEDPILNSIHFTEYRGLFNYFKDKYNLDESKKDLNQHINALIKLKEKYENLKMSIDITSSAKKRIKAFKITLYCIWSIWGICLFLGNLFCKLLSIKGIETDSEVLTSLRIIWVLGIFVFLLFERFKIQNRNGSY